MILPLSLVSPLSSSSQCELELSARLPPAVMVMVLTLSRTFERWVLVWTPERAGLEP